MSWSKGLIHALFIILGLGIATCWFAARYEIRRIQRPRVRLNPMFERDWKR